MDTYHALLKRVFEQGSDRDDRTGTGTLSIFGHQVRYNLNEGFPLVTTKKVRFDAVALELLWFLRGDTNIKYLNDHGVHIWDPWADDEGNLGPVYGSQWRSWKGPRGRVVDQIQNVIDEIRENPDSRRLVVSAWNPAEIEDMALPPCHCLFQFYVNDGKLSCQLYQRSADAFIGVPYNIASYALLTHMIAHVTGLGVGEFIHTFGDLHVYANHVPQVLEQLSRSPKILPTLTIKSEAKSIDEIKLEDLLLEDYDPHPFIPAPVAV